ncbi:DNA-binding XRE family transcriptional regulator [Serratia fonticola]|uniref:DNA-binding XRE family transcriptional regulator n=1 Tax=Serratia fonticola TaxID=47917 RepID=A0A559SH05_SERFO|nr:helix-turn-helix transcriptional regulator [Serratia fonticola]TQI77267.1 DNA-binding XRE family transcriptional regulator [Serratia fonticola]TQI93607.1 DNA-binding XRE family transcriptional regulator [Serratia fonticola]TVZ61636.1 DNA-binding XRE family transcriptional regulator [Serratia fonticola]
MVPKRLKEAREAAGLTQKQLAELVAIEGVNLTSRISNYEVGRFTPSFDFVVRVAKALNYPEYYFYVVDDDVAELLLQHHQSAGSMPLFAHSPEYMNRDSKKYKASLEEALGMAERLTSYIKKSVK